MPDLSLPQIIGGLATSAVSGGGASSFFNWLTTRKKNTAEGKAYTMGAVDHAVQTAMGLVTDRLERVEGQHEECERKLGEVRDDLAAAKQEISRLMSGRVAAFGEQAPRDE